MSIFKTRAKTEYIVIHHAASSRDITAAEIDASHKRKGKLGIGYHFVVRQAGGIEEGRPKAKEGAHLRSYNDRSIGIVLTGNLQLRPPPEAQLQSLVTLVKRLQKEYPEAKVIMHRDKANTLCPGKFFPAEEFRELLRETEDGVSNWARAPQKWVMENWISDGTNPKGAVTREALWTMLYRYHYQSNKL